MQSISSFHDKTKFTDFQGRNGDVSRSQGVCHVIHVFIGWTLGKL